MILNYFLFKIALLIFAIYKNASSFLKKTPNIEHDCMEECCFLSFVNQIVTLQSLTTIDFTLSSLLKT